MNRTSDRLPLEYPTAHWLPTALVTQSNQGSHFTSAQYRELLLAADVQISMDGKGRTLDSINALTAVAFGDV
jgi:transposase InsO family protein